MTESERPLSDDPRDEPADEDRVAERAHLLPEEISAGSADPIGQAEQILAESDDRTDDPERTQQEYSQTNESDAGNSR
ncbi:MAG: hypothetical protein AVDCRST_MAG61-2404 [uncultured Friedmanniella sp.]|uniref:Uncharacterized protein n=1 Tax=uncultured Friedmanniella sp. TaxID=335381 RepID=A0A6J4LA10_9ACTN|nr:hypothetical protein [uncultured Friedmanniella sp.]CAA9323270.1 MAG: hypothetical protein AVDCRST_MAG61-2404 [uncultured Friedmanniella sp.]